MHAEADVWALNEGQVLTGVYTVQVEAVGIVEDRRVPVDCRQRDCNQVALPDVRPGDLHAKGGVAVDETGAWLDPERLLDGVG